MRTNLNYVYPAVCDKMKQLLRLLVTALTIMHALSGSYNTAGISGVETGRGHKGSSGNLGSGGNLAADQLTELRESFGQIGRDGFSKDNSKRAIFGTLGLASKIRATAGRLSAAHAANPGLWTSDGTILSGLDTRMFSDSNVFIKKGYNGRNLGIFTDGGVKDDSETLDGLSDTFSSVFKKHHVTPYKYDAGKTDSFVTQSASAGNLPTYGRSSSNDNYSPQNNFGLSGSSGHRYFIPASTTSAGDASNYNFGQYQHQRHEGAAPTISAQYSALSASRRPNHSAIGRNAQVYDKGTRGQQRHYGNYRKFEQNKKFVILTTNTH